MPEKSEIRYSIEIDEEGYPLFDGLRINDAELLGIIFQNLRRRDKDLPRSPLVTVCEGETSYVLGFSDPLVAQSIDRLAPDKFRWNFLGELSHEVSLDQIQEDEWGRLHAYVGDYQVPAVLSRKAQAAFLQVISQSHDENLSFPLWRSGPNDVQSQNFWDETYVNKSDGWELGSPTPVLVKHWPSAQKALGASPLNILVPGVGRGHDAIFLAEQKNTQVTAVDFSSEAEKEFKKLYPQSTVNFERADIFTHLAQKPQSYDVIFEHTLFCAIDPKLRLKYLEYLTKALKPGGAWLGIFFIHTFTGGPPFGLTQWELREMTQKDFFIKDWVISPHSVKGRLKHELWAVLQKK